MSQTLSSSPLEGLHPRHRATQPFSFEAKALTKVFLNANDSSNPCHEVFCKLRILDISGLESVCEDYAEQCELARSIKKIISSARQLETLKVGSLLMCTFPQKPPQTKMADILGPRIPGHLQFLTVEDVDTTLRQLVNFFRNSRSLVGVQFRFVDCQDDKWSVVLDHLRSLQYPKLEWFKLDDCSDTDGENEYYEHLDVQDYLLHKTDHNPWLPEPADDK